MHGRTFQENLFIIPLSGCDLSLRNDWMKKKICVTIGRKSNKLVLKGISKKGKLRKINSGAMGKFLKKGNALLAHLFIMASAVDQHQEPEDIL